MTRPLPPLARQGHFCFLSDIPPLLRYTKSVAFAIHQKRVKIPLLMLFVGLFVGLFFAAQLQAEPTRITNPALPKESLAEMQTGLLTEQEELRAKQRVLQQEISDLEKSGKLSGKLTASLTSNLEAAKTSAGLTEIDGRGVEVVLSDARGQATAERLITAADLRDVIATLAESRPIALAIGNERLAETSSIDAVGDTILVNNTRMLPPFRIFALGDAVAMRGKLANPEKLQNLHHRQSSVGIQFDVFERSSLTIPAYTGSLYPKYLAPEVVR